NMTGLALVFSRYVNGVALRHEQISRGMFPGYPIHSISNGVHAVTWTADPFRRSYDRHFPERQQDNLYLRYVVSPVPDGILPARGVGDERDEGSPQWRPEPERAGRLVARRVPGGGDWLGHRRRRRQVRRSDPRGGFTLR